MKEKRIEKRKIKEIKKEQAKRKKIATQGLGKFISSLNGTGSGELFFKIPLNNSPDPVPLMIKIAISICWERLPSWNKLYYIFLHECRRI